MKILLDQDEVLAKWNARILEWFNEDEGTSFVEEDIKDAWNIEATLGPQAKHFIRSCMRWPEFYTNLEPVEGAIKGVKQLLDWGHDVMIVSAVPKCAGIAYHGKLQWLRQSMPFFDVDNFVAIKKKDRMIGDLLLDDGPHNIKAFSETKRLAVVMDKPHNRNIENSDFVTRVRNWDEFLQLIKNLDSFDSRPKEYQRRKHE